MKLAVLTDSESASGFRLAGLEVEVADTPEEAVEALRGLIARGDLALVAVDQGLLTDPLEAVEREMRGRDLPVILPFPSLAFAFEEDQEGAKGYIRALVKSTIGYEIKL